MVCGGTSKIWRGCIDGPCQALNYGIVRVNHPAASLGVANSAMILLQKMHGLGFTSAGEFCPSAPSEQVDQDRMDVFCQLPCVVKDTGLFVVVVDLLVGDACGLGEKARVGVKVEDAGQKLLP